MTSSSRFGHSGFFALRTPLLPFDEFVHWGDGLPSTATELEQNRTILRERLREAVTRPELREAIFVSSPVVAELMDAWANAPDSTEGQRVERALVRYFSRATGRSTPHALLAGISWGQVGDETRIELGPRAQYSRQARISLDCLLAIVEQLRSRPEVADIELYGPNRTLYRAAGRMRFIGGGRKRYELVSVRPTQPLETVLASSAGSTRPELVGTGSARFVDRMIEAGLLVPSQPVTLTRAKGDGGLRSWPGLRASPDAAKALDECATELDELSRESLGASIDRYRLLEKRLAELAGDEESGARLHVELSKPSPSATLGAEVVEEIARGIELAHRLGRPNPPDPELENFRQRFGERYGTRGVPLLEALDPEVGVGFGAGPERHAPVVEDVLALKKNEEIPWGSREQWLLARLWNLRDEDSEELVLSASDVEELAGTTTSRRPLPDELAGLAVVAARSDAELRSGRFQVLVKGYGGPGAVGVLSRFCLSDRDLGDALRSHLRAEEAVDEDSVFAEIVHLPSAPHADLLTRPVLRDYEIVCLGPSGAPAERQIQLNDLHVSLDEDGSIVLRSERLGRRVVPRLTSAHNFDLFGAKPYRFLCKLQFQGTDAGVDFWGPLAELPRLPLVRIGRTILQRARWRLTERELGSATDSAAAFLAIQRWRRTVGAPRLVALSELDKELPVDLDNILSVESLAHAVRSSGEGRLVEWFPPPGESCVRGPEGEFAHELLVPFVRARRAGPVRRAHAVPPRTQVRRAFAPGSEWTYVKWFTSASAIDGLLADAVGPLVAQLREAEAIDRWFFMRYDGPAYELRLRLHAAGEREKAEARTALEATAEKLLESGLLSHVEVGTYVRELERYGGPEAIELAEEIFHADSDAVLDLVRLVREARVEDFRWRLALFGAHAALVDLGLDLHARDALAGKARDALRRQEEISSEQVRRIGERFRQERSELSRLLDDSADRPRSWERAFRILDARGVRMRPLAHRLRELEQGRGLTRPLAEIAASHAHMHLNRLLRARHREYELVIYEFLARLYEAAARQAASSGDAPR